MSFQPDRNDARRRKPGAESESGGERAAEAPPQRPRKRRLPATDVGNALKSAYDRTVHEDIPPEMLDLLGKLG